MPDESNSTDGGPEVRRLKTHYIKSNFFRVVHVDGIFGGLTPRGDIHIDFYSERQPIPQQMTFEITETKMLGDEVRTERVAKESVVREVEVGAVIDVALATGSWLSGCKRKSLNMTSYPKRRV